jgi:hypothetical protein
MMPNLIRTSVSEERQGLHSADGPCYWPVMNLFEPSVKDSNNDFTLTMHSSSVFT